LIACPSCGEPVKTHANWPETKIYLNATTGLPHECNPNNKIIRTGKWVGYTVGEANSITLSVREKDKKRLDEIQRMVYGDNNG
jgi:hypothetical protein